MLFRSVQILWQYSEFRDNECFMKDASSDYKIYIHIFLFCAIYIYIIAICVKRYNFYVNKNLILKIKFD